MLEIKRILCPIAGTDESNQVLAAASSIAEKFGSKLTVLNIAPIKTLDLIRPQGPLVSDDLFPDQIRERLEKHSNQVLAKAQQFLPEQDVEYRAVIGHAATLICETAKEENFDLIVLGCRKHSLLEGMLLGSVSTHVVQNSPCPVFVVRGKA